MKFVKLFVLFLLLALMTAVQIANPHLRGTVTEVNK
jgi:hypothetical protein